MKSQSYILKTLCLQVLEVLLFRGLMLSGSYVRLSNTVHNGTTTMGPTRVSLSALSKLCVNIKLNLGHNGPGGTWSPGNISTLLLHCTACSAQWLLFQFTSRLLTEAIWCCSDCVLLALQLKWERFPFTFLWASCVLAWTTNTTTRLRGPLFCLSSTVAVCGSQSKSLSVLKPNNVRNHRTYHNCNYHVNLDYTGLALAPIVCSIFIW